jgi:cholest-4-en-3-one 26-monooxygenase
VAGNETTRNAITHGMIAFFENPDQWTRLRNDRSLMPTAVDEVVRWASPVIYFRRSITQDTELRGQKMKEGDKMTIWYPSANRDEDVFTDPFVFDVGRTPNDHLGFGGRGPHFCLGSNLAKMEMSAIYNELLDRMPDLAYAGEPARLRSNFINGIKRLPVTYSPSKPVLG